MATFKRLPGKRWLGASNSGNETSRAGGGGARFSGSLGVGGAADGSKKFGKLPCDPGPGKFAGKNGAADVPISGRDSPGHVAGGNSACCHACGGASVGGHAGGHAGGAGGTSNGGAAGATSTNSNSSAPNRCRNASSYAAFFCGCNRQMRAAATSFKICCEIAPFFPA